MNLLLFDTGTTKFVNEFVNELVNANIDVLIDLTRSDKTICANNSFIPANRTNLRYWTAINDIEFIDIFNTDRFEDLLYKAEERKREMILEFYDIIANIIKKKSSKGLKIAGIIHISKNLQYTSNIFQEKGIKINVNYKGQTLSINELLSFLGSHKSIFIKEREDLIQSETSTSTIVFSKYKKHERDFNQILTEKGINIMIGHIGEVNSYKGFYSTNEPYFVSCCEIIKNGGVGFSPIIQGEKLLDTNTVKRLEYITELSSQLIPFLNINNIKLGILIDDSDFKVGLQSVRLARLLISWGFNVLMEDEDAVYNKKDILHFGLMTLSEIRMEKEKEEEYLERMERQNDDNQGEWERLGNAEMKSWGSGWQANID